MEIIIGLLLLAAFVLWIISFRESPAYLDRAAFGCLLLAVALLAFADRLVR
jgi:hypothetical protein